MEFTLLQVGHLWERHFELWQPTVLHLVHFLPIPFLLPQRGQGLRLLYKTAIISSLFILIRKVCYCIKINAKYLFRIQYEKQTYK